MKRILAIVLLLVGFFVIYLLDNDKFNVPALGKLISPTHGFWQNAERVKASNSDLLVLKTPNGEVEVYYDERGVPHIFAENEKALYYAQGYVQAKDRLWQMDFQVRIAAGRLSEAIGPSGLDYDRFFRRIGIPKSATEIVESLNEDPIYNAVVISYMDGINSYIKKLKKKDYPLEFKLANYAPELWSLEKSVLLLKLMALRLSGFDTDVANNNNLNVMDMATFNSLFPDFPKDESPIIPSGTPWDFSPVAVTEADTERDTGLLSSMKPPISSHRGIGSNNWAVGQSKAEDGGAILCNDPHLGLAFPSIWYEMQLHTPDMNVYGVTIPGSPCIIIGFNEDIAWGVTNGSRDVRDWYSIQYKDDTQTEYLFDGEYLPVDQELEHIKVRNGDDLIDTVNWTIAGPVMYDEHYGSSPSRRGLAMHWLGLEVSNELKAFYYLNKASNHTEYLEALNYYDNPAQNFVFADRSGNIAIKEQGKFRIRRDHGGKFVERLEDQNLEQLNNFIPYAHNPHVYNPARGFVSSANQQPTDDTYPYYYSGWFETYRNRRVNNLLDSMESITIEDMLEMHNDGYNMMGEEILPFLLSKLEAGELGDESQSILDTLSAWNYVNDHMLTAPAYFENWWENIMETLWDELADSNHLYRFPTNYSSFQFIQDFPDHELIDNMKTSSKETVDILINDAYRKMVDYFSTKADSIHRWQYYNQSSIEHLMSLNAFSRFNMPVGGSENAIKANFGNHGPSWRMVVRLNDDGVEAYGVYPGGQTGNPGSQNYDSFVDEWIDGEHFKLNFYPDRTSAIQAITNE